MDFSEPIVALICDFVDDFFFYVQRDFRCDVILLLDLFQTFHT